jgi:hypothetical protein
MQIPYFLEPEKPERCNNQKETHIHQNFFNNSKVGIYHNSSQI